MSAARIDELARRCKAIAPDFVLEEGKYRCPRMGREDPTAKVSCTHRGKPHGLELVASPGTLTLEEAKLRVLEESLRTLEEPSE